MKSLLAIPAALFSCLLISSCLVSPVSKSGGVGATTVKNSTPSAIIGAATRVFADNGYTMGPVSYPSYASFDKPAGAFGQLMYGSYGQTTSYRARMNIVPVPGTNDYRIGVQMFRVNDAGQMGFESGTRMLGVWSAEFAPLLRQIAADASGAL